MHATAFHVTITTLIVTGTTIDHHKDKKTTHTNNAHTATVDTTPTMNAENDKMTNKVGPEIVFHKERQILESDPRDIPVIKITILITEIPPQGPFLTHKHKINHKTTGLAVPTTTTTTTAVVTATLPAVEATTTL